MAEPEPLLLPDHRLEWGRRTYIMAILNVTPDSFTGIGPGLDAGAAVRRAEQDLADGADILDIGGESTRPGAIPVEATIELRRVIPVIERLAARRDTVLSIDTTKAEVADRALRAGAKVVNDISGMYADPAMAGVVARHHAAVVVMANLRGRRYAHVIPAIRQRLRGSLALAQQAGIPRDCVIVDPGFGFGPTAAQNLEMIRKLGRIRALGHPVLIGTSRKSTIGRVLDLPVEERLEGTAATVALAIAHGADIVRVHDTQAMVRVARMSDAIMRGWQPEAGAQGRAH